MPIKSQLEADLKIAMKSGDDVKKRVLRLLLSSLKLAEVEKGNQLDDASVLAIIQKEIKMRKEALEGAEQAGRASMVQDTLDETKILEEYLPKQLADEELRAIVMQVIQEVGANAPTDTGKVMKALMPKIQGRAAGDKVSLIVRQSLQNL